MTFLEAVKKVCITQFLEGKIKLSETSHWSFEYEKDPDDIGYVEDMAEDVSGESFHDFGQTQFEAACKKAAEYCKNIPFIKALS